MKGMPGHALSWMSPSHPLCPHSWRNSIRRGSNGICASLPLVVEVAGLCVDGTQVALVASTDRSGACHFEVENIDGVLALLEPRGGAVEAELRADMPVTSEVVSVHPDNALFVLGHVEECVLGGMRQDKGGAEMGSSTGRRSCHGCSVDHVRGQERKSADAPARKGVAGERDGAEQAFAVELHADMGVFCVLCS